MTTVVFFKKKMLHTTNRHRDDSHFPRLSQHCIPHYSCCRRTCCSRFRFPRTFFRLMKFPTSPSFLFRPVLSDTQLFGSLWMCPQKCRSTFSSSHKPPRMARHFCTQIQIVSILLFAFFPIFSINQVYFWLSWSRDSFNSSSRSDSFSRDNPLFVANRISFLNFTSYLETKNEIDQHCTFAFALKSPIEWSTHTCYILKRCSASQSKTISNRLRHSAFFSFLYFLFLFLFFYLLLDWFTRPLPFQSKLGSVDHCWPSLFRLMYGQFLCHFSLHSLEIGAAIWIQLFEPLEHPHFASPKRHYDGSSLFFLSTFWPGSITLSDLRHLALWLHFDCSRLTESLIRNTVAV